MSKLIDVVLLSLAAFLGNVGVSLAGFGMAIVFIFVWQITVLLGYDSNFKYAIFIQALSLFSVQPLLLYKTRIRQFASRKMLLYFIPLTIVSTPLGQFISSRVSTDVIEVVGGILVTFIAILEFYEQRKSFAAWLRCDFRGNKKEGENDIESQLLSNPVDAYARSSIRRRMSMNVTIHRSYLPTSFSAKYHLDKILGHGGFSIVRSGTNKTTGETFAIKIFKKNILEEDEEQRLMKEVEIMQDLKHKNIINFHDFYDEESSYYLVIEKMDGGDLLERLEVVTAFKEKRACQILKDVVDAVDFMHSKNIAHRDLKPENLLFDSTREAALVKIADFGLSKKEVTPNCFKTMCGTPSYIAPEILQSLPYGITCDLWSLGVIAYCLLSGYQPFRGETDQKLRQSIKNGHYKFEDEFWSDISDEAKNIITSLLNINPIDRTSTKELLNTPWFSIVTPESPQDKNENEPKAKSPVPTTLVFFMIGSQRSGSNWLRTMMDEREDLASPHPPHIMRDFSPILERYGDLQEECNFKTLVDHVCAFVESNQVSWTDKHSQIMQFPRWQTYNLAHLSCDRLVETRCMNGARERLDNKLYLLSIFDAIMTIFTEKNGKIIWMCKSMGMSMFHDELVEFYGKERLRYLYLVRDPRDVCMSFMKTPVGDCHYYAIIKKWTKLQKKALEILKSDPCLVHKVHYERILSNREEVMSKVYDFIGERRFGGIKRQATVIFMKENKDLINGAKRGREAQKAMKLSYQFQNLGRGASFVKVQLEKWRNPITGLKYDDLQLIESVAYKIMGEFTYETAMVGKTTEPTLFSKEDITLFGKLNREGIEKMNADLQVENPGDHERRYRQAQCLLLQPSDVVGDWSDTARTSDISELSNILPDSEIEARLNVEPQKTLLMAPGESLSFSTASIRGYYPDQHDKPNQDAAFSCVIEYKNGNSYLFSVYDGHGPSGDQCAIYASRNIPKLFETELTNANITTVLEEIHLMTHKQLMDDPGIDESLSGSTAVSLIIKGKQCYISNLGDSTCIIGSCTTDGIMTSKTMCSAHTPLREDERDRILNAGGLLMTLSERNEKERQGGSVISLNQECQKDLRVWSDDDKKYPGCALTRSLGDTIAHSLGVTALPEVYQYSLIPDDKVFIVASDGITEYMDEKTCVDIVCRYSDASVAAKALVKEASKHWIDKSDYMDDITAIIIFHNSSHVSEGDENDENDNLVDEHNNPTVKHDAKNAKDKTIDQYSFNSTVKHYAKYTKEEDNVIELNCLGRLWTIIAGCTSGFLGGLCGIRGPPLILYFLHAPVVFTQDSQRATGACITFTNVTMRIVYYIINTLFFDQVHDFKTGDWGLYLSIIICSNLGVIVGSELFEYIKDSRTIVKSILAIFLLLCGVSLTLSSFIGKL